jgi:Tfp pilus assembly protein PilW
MKGFTLIEILIYVSIFSFVLVLICGFFWDTIFSSVRGNIIQEIQDTASFAIFKISKEIKRAKSINFPSQGNSGNYLSLEMSDSELNPTVFELEGRKLKITQGSNPSYYLTPDSVTISNLSFSNLSFSNTPGTIKVEIEISSPNPLYKNSFFFQTVCTLFPNQ